MNNWTVVFLMALLSLSSCTFKPSSKYDIQAPKALLPQDEAPHIKNSLEWWYFTGHLKTESNKEYGLEYVFFHFNPFGKKDYMMVNFAVTDPEDSAFYYDYKVVKRKNLLSNQLPIDFSIEKKGNTWTMQGQEGKYELQAAMTSEPITIALSTELHKPLLLHDGTGYEQYGKYATAGYYSYPRMNATGTITIDGKEEHVSGNLWYDRQWNCIGVWEKDIAWDWISIQLDDPQDEIMAYSLHHLKDSVTVVGGSLFKENKERINLEKDKVFLEPLEYWKSPDSKRNYPVKWSVKIPDYSYDLIVKAVIPNQELKLQFTPVTRMFYWEGMCIVSGTRNGIAVTGKSYIEMTNRK